MDDTIEEKYKEIHRQFLNFITATMDKLQDDLKMIKVAMERMHQEGR